MVAGVFIARSAIEFIVINKATSGEQVEFLGIC